MALMALMADALGGHATHRDKEDEVPMRLPVAVALHSLPRQGKGERFNSSYVEEPLFDVGNW